MRAWRITMHKLGHPSELPTGATRMELFVTSISDVFSVTNCLRNPASQTPDAGPKKFNSRLVARHSRGLP
jgi:hypothetical protein